MHDIVANSILQSLRNLERASKEQVTLQRAILRHLNASDRVIGGSFHQIPTGDNIMQPIQPGNSPKFVVTPTFSGPPFPLIGANAAINTSDAVNAPAALDLVDDPTGATFVINLTAGAAIPTGGEAIVVTWQYTNPDGVVATVTGTLTEEGILDDVTGGAFEQVS